MNFSEGRGRGSTRGVTAEKNCESYKCYSSGTPACGERERELRNGFTAMWPAS